MPDIYLCPACGDPVVDAPQQQWTSTAVATGGWRHLDDSPLCPGGVPTRVAEPEPADPDTDGFTTAVTEVFARTARTLRRGRPAPWPSWRR